MTDAGIQILQCGPGVTIQDMGRIGEISHGISRGGAMDPLALAQVCTLAQTPTLAAIEFGAGSLVLEIIGATQILCVAGPAMQIRFEGRELASNAAHQFEQGAKIEIRLLDGGYGYICPGGGLSASKTLGSMSAHIAAGIGKVLKPGDVIETSNPGAGWDGYHFAEDVSDKSPAEIRILPSVQSHLFDQGELDRFVSTRFQKSLRANRMGMALEFEGQGFQSKAHLSITSDIVVPGDIQLVGEGQPYVLFGECQSTGGYPRIATVISADLSRLAQLRAGEPISFRMIELDEALVARRDLAKKIATLDKALTPILRDPAEMGDLLSYQLISGATTGEEAP